MAIEPLCANCGQMRGLHSMEPPYDLVYGDDEYCEGFEYVKKEATHGRD